MFTPQNVEDLPRVVVSRKTAAKALDCSEDTVRRMTERGELKACRFRPAALASPGPASCGGRRQQDDLHNNEARRSWCCDGASEK